MRVNFKAKEINFWPLEGKFSSGSRSLGHWESSWVLRQFRRLGVNFRPMGGNFWLQGLNFINKMSVELIFETLEVDLGHLRDNFRVMEVD